MSLDAYEDVEDNRIGYNGPFCYGHITLWDNDF